MATTAYDRLRSVVSMSGVNALERARRAGSLLAPVPSADIEQAAAVDAVDVGPPVAPISIVPPVRPLSARDRLSAAARGGSDELGMPEVVSAPQRSAAPGPARTLSARDRLAALASRSADDDDLPPYEAEPDDGEPPVSSAEPETVSGLLASLRVFNGWGVGTVWLREEREEVKVTGEGLAGLTEGLEYEFRGVRRDDPRHGESLVVQVALPTISVDSDAIVDYLVKSFKGIGRVKAGKYVREVQESAVTQAREAASANLSAEQIKAIQHESLAALRDQLLKEPWKLDLSKLSKNAAFEGGEDPQNEARKLVVTRNFMLRLGGMQGFSERLAKDLAAHMLSGLPVSTDEDGAPVADLYVDPVEDCWTRFVTDPYKPIRKVKGYGFRTAENIARALGIPKDSPLRLGPLVEYAVEEACSGAGHTFLSPVDFVSAIKRVDPSVNAQQALNHGVKVGTVMIEPGANRVYAPRLFEAESRLAKNLARLLHGEPLTQRSAEDVRRKLRKDAASINPAFEAGLDESQIDAVASIMTSPSRVHVLTGGPGTGKTSIVECVVSLLKNRSMLFAAPTGKAAKVLTSRVRSSGHQAVTTCSLLKGAEDAGFEVNEGNPLDCDLLIVDESTMNGVVMADALLASLPPKAHILFLGDPGVPSAADRPARAGQLPSISPGNFMLDLQQIEGINCVNLTKTFRNSGGILDVVNEVAEGRLSVKNREDVVFSMLPEANVGFGSVMAEYLRRVEQDGIANTLLVIPKRAGDRNEPGWNSTYANHVLRQVCNPNGQKLPGTLMHVGDRIIIRDNATIEQPSAADLVRHGGGRPFEASSAADGGDDNAFIGDEEEGKQVRVVNGDTGTIASFYFDPKNTKLASPRWIGLKLDDGREVYYPGEDIGSLDHAYALTVHSSQGSEYKHVLSCVTPGSAGFMNQNMILTAWSRAKGSLHVFGDPATLVKIARTPMPARNTALVERVELALESLDEAEEAGEVQADV